MRIIYVAKHNSGNGDDEGAITHALEEQGHTVERLHEQRGHIARRFSGDVLLFHKWHEPNLLRQIRIPKVFWYFDLVDYDDPTLSPRNRARIEWMRSVLPFVHLGFCTDGDWVARDTSRKLHWLPQGFDDRNRAEGPRREPQIPLLFTGVHSRAGRQRDSWVREMERVYGPAFFHVRGGVYGSALATMIADTQIVLAPDGPVTSRYWSNRIYNVCGYGGFLLHPRTEGLIEAYRPDLEAVYYHSREELHQLIQYYLSRPNRRREVAEAARARTLAEHTYRHRVRVMVETLRKGLGI